MNLNEACTAVSYELPIITVIFNNSVLGMVRQWQTTFYEKRYSQTDPHRRTDFVKRAEGVGLKGYRCTNLPEFQAAFADALKQKGPTWIECIIDKDEKVLPMIPGGGDINDIIMEFKYIDEIPLYKGGPIATDTLFYLHTLADIPGAISICKGLYLNGDFEEIKRYILLGI